MLSRRNLFAAGASAALALPAASQAAEPELSSITGDARPITVDERRARIAKAQGLMHEQRIGALLVESGSTLDYFTGIQWWRSERTTAALIPARGEVVVVTPHFEEPSVRETLQVGDDVRPWNEHESPFALLAGAMRDRGVAGPLAVESTTRFFIVDGMKKAAPGLEVVNGDPVTLPCRMFKSPAELALMQAANDVTLAAFRWAHPRVRPGMTAADIGALIEQATARLGGENPFTLVLLNEASAFPHGSQQPQTVREGSIVLLDCGCQVGGYSSDISRTFVYGEPTARQRELWNTVKRGQEIALEAARPGVPVGSIDEAVRAYYESLGGGPEYKLPGLSHRTGHGIGMDVHENAYLVRSDRTPLQPGMCFSDEPGLYIPGEFGVRLEDCWHMTEQGPKLFSGLARSIDEPI
jgi:Xaa-Pro dipeptidase